jgi:PhzF family phenazine biosynthesis protein
MKTRPFKQVDVFTATPYLGNPLAVVLDGTDLSDAEMQHFAHWTHLSETVFLLPPSPQGAVAGADYQVRIFTPAYELPFAGHPTLGSCHAWLEAGGKPQAAARVVQECKVGLIQINHEGERLAFAAPALQRSALEPALMAQVIAMLGLKPEQIIATQRLNNGPVFVGLLLDSPQTVLQLTPDFLQLQNSGFLVGVAAVESPPFEAPLITRSNREARAFGARFEMTEKPLDTPGMEVRVFTAPVGVNEDPVTGSFNASLAQWLIADGHVPHAYIAAQGTCLGRAGRVHITQDAAGQVWVGGQSVTCVEGQVRL